MQEKLEKMVFHSLDLNPSENVETRKMWLMYCNNTKLLFRKTKSSKNFTKPSWSLKMSLKITKIMQICLLVRGLKLINSSKMSNKSELHLNIVFTLIGMSYESKKNAHLWHHLEASFKTHCCYLRASTVNRIRNVFSEGRQSYIHQVL